MLPAPRRRSPLRTASTVLIITVLACLAVAAPRRQELFVHAVVRDNLPMMRILLWTGASPTSDATGGHPLEYAAYAGHADAAELLLAHGASVDSRDRSGVTPLMAAASRGNDAVVRVLLAHGASVTIACPGGNALDWALARQHDSTAAILRKAGAIPSQATPPGGTTR